MFYTDRPKIKVEKNSFDYIIEYSSFAIVILSVIYTIFHFKNLPDLIPMHFNFSGEVNRYDNKNSIIALHFFEIITVYGIYYLNRFPQVFNYPQKITEENAAKNYKAATRMMRYMNFFIALLFGTISIEIINISLAKSTLLNPISNYLFILALTGVLVVPVLGLIDMYRKTKH